MIEEQLKTQQRMNRHERMSLVRMAEDAGFGTVPVHRLDNGVPHRTTLDDRNQLLLYRLTSARMDHTDAMRFPRQSFLSSFSDEND